LFSFSIVALGICLDYCLDLMLKCLGSAPPLRSRPSPADPLPFLSSNPTSVRVVGGPPGWAWSSNTPLPNRAGTPTKTGPWSSNAPTGQPGGTSLRRDPLGYFSPFLTPPLHMQFLGELPLNPVSPSVWGGPPRWGGLRKGGRTQGGALISRSPKRLRRFGFEGLCF